MSDFTRIKDNVQKMVDQGAPSYDIDGYLSTEGFNPREFKTAVENYGTFTSAVKRGGKNVGSLIADFIPIMGATALEKIAPESFQPSIQNYKKRQYEEAMQTQEEIAKRFPAEFETYQQIEDPIQALNYAKEAFGESLASFLPGVVTGGLGSFATRGAVAKASQAAGEMAKRKALEEAKEAAVRGAPGAAEEFVSGIAGQRAAALGKTAAEKALFRNQLAADVGSAYVGSAALNIPAAFQTIYSETGQESLLPAIGAGSFNALLDAATPVSLIRAARGKGITNEELVGAWYLRGAKGLGKGALTEGFTEAAQEVTNAAAVNFVDENKEIFTPENLVKFIDSGLRGAIGGGGVQMSTDILFGKAEGAKPTQPQGLPPGPPPGTPPTGGPVPPTIYGEPAVSELELEGVATPEGPGFAPARDLAGVVPKGRLPEATENLRPILDKEGKVVGYEEQPPAPPAPPELEGEQLEMPLTGQQELFPGKAPTEQPAPTPLPTPAAPEAIDLPGTVESTVKEAKQDPSASKILKGNNPASTKALNERLTEFLKTNEDPIQAMEQLFEADRTARLPAGMKALSEAQKELLETVYKRMTGMDIDTGIRSRQFQGAEQAGLFEEGAPPAPPVTAPPAAPMDPEAAWNRHKNDDHPAFGDLNAEEKNAWLGFVNRGHGSAVNFQDIVNLYNERLVGESTQTPEQIEKVFEEEKKITDVSIENEIRGLDYDGLLDYALNNGPAGMREMMKRVKEAVDRMKKRGYKFTFTLSTSPSMSRALQLSNRAAGHVYPKGNLMELVISGTGSGRPFGATYEVVMHELLHTVTIALIRHGQANPNTNEGRIVKEIEDLRSHVKKELERKRRNGTIKPYELQFLTGTNAFGSKHYGRTVHKADEMVSWSMTNADFRRVLEGIQYKGKSAFNAFVEMIRRLIGLSPKAQTALAEILSLTEQLVTSQTPVTPMPRAGRPVGMEAPNTPAFKRWFGDSKVVNEDGTPKVMYHGTPYFEGYEFKPFESKNRTGNIDGYYFTASTQDASDYAGTEEGAEVIPTFLSIKNPYVPGESKVTKAMRDQYFKEMIEANDDMSDERAREYAQSKMYYLTERGLPLSNAIGSSGAAFQRIIKAGGYDGYQDGIGSRHWVAFEPNQIKSAIGNVGTFSPEEESIVSSVPAEEDIFSAIAPGVTATPTAPAPMPAPGPSVPGLGKKYTLPTTTKLQPSPTTSQKVKDAAKNITNAFNGDWWTKFRIAAVDPGSGLSKTLSSLPIFQNGQLRADMLIRSFNQVINLIKVGLQTGVPVVNSDGSIVIQRDANNMARSQILADKLDANEIVKGTGLSGRGYVAEISRILRGREIQQVDAERRRIAAGKMLEAKQKIALAKQYKAAGASLTDIMKLVNEAKAIRKMYLKDLTLNREKQVTQAHIDWAEQQLDAVPEVQEILDIWRNINRSLLDLWENTGLLSKEEADRLRKRNFYVPLYASRVDLLPSEQETYTGKGTGTKTVRLIEHLEGSELQRNIWENMDKHYASQIAAAYQNQTRRIAVQQLMSMGINAARIAENPSNPDVNLRYKDPTDPNADKHGVVHVILDNPNDLTAFQMMNYELGPLMKGISATTQVLRAGALINPIYWIRQLIRDPIHASIAGNLDQIVTPFHAAKEYVQVLRDNSEEARILAERGVIGQIDPTITIQDFLKQVGTEKLSPNMLDKAIHKVMRMHEASDAATRVAIFKNEKAYALKQGMSEKDAINYAVHKARESINFAVRGNSKTLNVLRHSIPFFSAAVTSLDTLYRTATGYGLNPAEKKAAQDLFMKRAAMMVVFSAVYAMLMQDDEDYKKLPDNVKDDNWLLPSPIGSAGSFIKIPIPFEVGFLFKTIPEGAVRYMADTSTGKEVLGSYFRSLRRSLPGEAVLIPQAFKPALESVFNYSLFTGRAIEGMSDQGLPVEMRGPNAGEFAKSLSRLGLSEIGLSPAKIDHLVQGYLAELGSFSTGMASNVITKATGKEAPAKNLENQGFFKAFLTDPNTSKPATDFYDLVKNSQEAVNAVNRMKKEGRVEELKEFISDEENIKLMSVAPSLRRIQDQMAQVRSQINILKRDYEGDPEERRQKINQLQKIYDQVARQGYRVMEAAGVSR